MKNAGSKFSGRWWLLLPVVGIVYCWRRFVSPKSPAELRAEEQARQSAIKRELRGLPPEHDQGSFGP